MSGTYNRCSVDLSPSHSFTVFVCRFCAVHYYYQMADCARACKGVERNDNRKNVKLNPTTTHKRITAAQSIFTSRRCVNNHNRAQYNDHTQKKVKVKWIIIIVLKYEVTHELQQQQNNNQIECITLISAPLPKYLYEEKRWKKQRFASNLINHTKRATPIAWDFCVYRSIGYGEKAK